MEDELKMPFGVAAVIPSYQPDGRLAQTVEMLEKAGTEYIVVVNDGSESEYSPIYDTVAGRAGCKVISHPENLGKGAAIKTGMRDCLENRAGLRAVVTVDGDGHHRIEDVVTCAELAVNSKTVALGMRKKNDGTLSRIGSYGNKITSLLIDVTCDFDMRITDPLTGLRCVPTEYLPTILETTGERYDFETNMILDFSRKDIPFSTFSSVGVYYDDGRRSHFKIIKDTFRILVEIAKYFGKQFKYVMSSLCCYSGEYILYRIILGYIDFVPVAYANVLSRACACTANFIINKKIVFNAKGHSFRHAMKYVILMVAVVAVSTILIDLPNRLLTSSSNFTAKYIKIPVDLCMFFVSYYAQKKWVFAEDENESNE